ncbi:MAG: VirS, partial [Lachnospiraceae bacterium]|nr:VirS [Lachnospiraceae bacterium]
NYVIIGVVELTVLIFASFYFDIYGDAIINIMTGMVLITVCFMFEGKFMKKLAYSLLVYFLVLFLDVCTSGIMTLIFNTTYFEMRSYGIIKFISNFINILTLGIIILIKKLRKKQAFRVNLSKRIYALLFAGAGMGIIIISSLMATTLPGTGDRMRRIMLLVTIIACVSYSVACLMLIIITESRDNFKMLSLINQNVIESQQKYYMLVNEKQQEMRSIRHEMKNHLSCVYGLYKSNKLHEMEQYMKELVEAAEMPGDLFDTGNDIVNAILNDAKSRYHTERIILHLEGGFPSELHIAPVDLCVIFANLVTNSVEAIRQLNTYNQNDNFIDIKISSFKDDIYIDVKNPTVKNVDIQNGTLITTKQDKKFHGFGTKNMKQRVEKYRGTINFKSENNYFFVEIYMKNKVMN